MLAYKNYWGICRQTDRQKLTDRPCCLSGSDRVNYCWPSPAHSFLVPSPVRHCLTALQSSATLTVTEENHGWLNHVLSHSGPYGAQWIGRSSEFVLLVVVRKTEGGFVYNVVYEHNIHIIPDDC
jgi:hypothetical protein